MTPRPCKCGCGAEFTPDRPHQKFARGHARAFWNRKKMNEQKRPHRATHYVPVDLRYGPRTKQYVCFACYNIGHAWVRKTPLACSVETHAVSIVGCPECGEPPRAEKLELQECLTSNARLALI